MSKDDKKEKKKVQNSLSSAFEIEKFKKLFGESFSDKRTDLVFMARTAESAERYEDMCKCMRTLVDECNKVDEDLTVEERNLLSVAYKNVIGARRASYRTLNAENDNKTQPIIDLYKSQVESELDSICRDVLNLLENKLIKSDIEGLFTKEAVQARKDKEEADPDCVKDGSAEAQVFYLKMAGDYYRYLAEGTIQNLDLVSSDNPEDTNDKKAANLYGRAFAIAEQALEATHPIRLGLALNFSVCYYEILKDRKKACDLAKEAFDTAISKLDSLQEADYKDSTLIMQLLRDNLTLWTSNQEEDGGEQEGGNDQETEQVE